MSVNYQEAEKKLSDAYLRLRAMIPGAYNTSHAPSPEQVWEQTERALAHFVQHFHEQEKHVRHMQDAFGEAASIINKAMYES